MLHHFLCPALDVEICSPVPLGVTLTAITSASQASGISVDATVTSRSSYHFDLVVMSAVPETSTSGAALMLGAIGTLAGLIWRRRGTR